ncbi:hypothetical protein ACQPYK_49030 (plasmid) [Streptosporangium sp. CA-135522]|uniref:hypothetical protein n=1 Tax=Streptosporangium sp. CA-135522 TaxID=3240072 RepID=UPI003D8B1802
MNQESGDWRLEFYAPDGKPLRSSVSDGHRSAPAAALYERLQKVHDVPYREIGEYTTRTELLVKEEQMERHYVKAGDVVTVLGKSTEAGLHMRFAGRRLEVELRQRHNGELYPAIRKPWDPDHPRTDCSMAEVAFYPDGDRWFYMQRDAERAENAPEWEG